MPSNKYGLTWLVHGMASNVCKVDLRGGEDSPVDLQTQGPGNSPAALVSLSLFFGVEKKLK